MIPTIWEVSVDTSCCRHSGPSIMPLIIFIPYFHQWRATSWHWVSSTFVDWAEIQNLSSLSGLLKSERGKHWISPVSWGITVQGPKSDTESEWLEIAPTSSSSYWDKDSSVGSCYLDSKEVQILCSWIFTRLRRCQRGDSIYVRPVLKLKAQESANDIPK